MEDITKNQTLLSINLDQVPKENEDGTEIEIIDSSLRYMEKPFDPTKINIETKTPSLDTLIKRIERGSVQLNTESYFQRKDDLWDKEKQSRLIESILIQFPLPAFFFDATDDNNWLVVDGLQRLSSIRNFVVDKTLKLTNLEFLNQLNGKSWNDLPGDLQRIIEEAQVVIYKIMPGTPTEVKFNIFKRINTGGLVLEAQEIRHALFQGKPSEFIYELANIKEFTEATNNKIKKDRMLDRDFANRFLCFYLLGVENYGKEGFGRDLDTFMSRAMASISNKTEIELKKIKTDFIESMKLAHSIFGKEAFRKIHFESQKLPPINKALFDAISVQFALINENDRIGLRENKKEFKIMLFQTLRNDEVFFTSVSSSTGDRNRVLYRHNKIKELINITLFL